MFALERRPDVAPALPRRADAAPAAKPPATVPPAWSALAYRLYRADPAAPAPAPNAPGAVAPPAQGAQGQPAQQPQAPPQPQSPPPTLQTGEVKIDDLGHEFVFPEPEIIKKDPRDDVRSGFTAKAQNVKLAGPPDVFVYGLVQNVMMDHYEASYGGGCDMMVPVAGPLLDIDKGNDPGPYMHEGGDNPITPFSTSFLPPSISPMFTDRPRYPVQREVMVNGSLLTLNWARCTLLFRVALVARDLRNRGLAQIGATGMYMVKWEVNIDAKGKRSLKNLNQLAGTYPLAAPGAPVTLMPPVANDVGQAAYDAEMARLKTSCTKLF